MFSLFPGRRNESSTLVARMVGVKMGDRIAQVGCANGACLAAVAAGVGLSGRAVAIVPDAPSAARAQKGAARAGVLVEIETAPPTRLPADTSAFDVAILDDSGGLFATMNAEDRSATVRELLRILRPGGRLMMIGAAPRSGFRALATRTQASTSFDPAPALRANGFGPVRMLAERDGFVFIEGLKTRSPSE